MTFDHSGTVDRLIDGAPVPPRTLPPRPLPAHLRPAGTAPAVQWRQARRDLAHVGRLAQARRALGRVVRRRAT